MLQARNSGMRARSQPAMMRTLEEGSHTGSQVLASQALGSQMSSQMASQMGSQVMGSQPGSQGGSRPSLVHVR